MTVRFEENRTGGRWGEGAGSIAHTTTVLRLREREGAGHGQLVSPWDYGLPAAPPFPRAEAQALPPPWLPT